MNETPGPDEDPVPARDPDPGDEPAPPMKAPKVTPLDEGKNVKDGIEVNET